MEILVRNFKLSLRQIQRQPGVSISVIVTLGVAIGATTAIFSFVNALLLRPFPFRDPAIAPISRELAEGFRDVKISCQGISAAV
jgi:hypothetical protein